MPAPALGLPRRTVSIPTAAITAARITLGSGVTSTTNPAKPVRDSTTRNPRPPPHSALSQKSAPTTIAQFAPEKVQSSMTEAKWACFSWSGGKSIA